MFLLITFLFAINTQIIDIICTGKCTPNLDLKLRIKIKTSTDGSYDIPANGIEII